MHQHALKCKKSVKRNQPWFTKVLDTSSLVCDKLCRAGVGLYKDNPLCIQYRDYRNMDNKIKRKAKQSYYYREVNKYKDNSQKLWSLMKKLLGR